MSASRRRYTKQPRVSFLRNASLATLPVELQVAVFLEYSSLFRPSTRNIEDLAAFQAELASFCLICKSTLSAARAVLLRWPVFRYQYGTAKDSLVKAFRLEGAKRKLSTQVMNSFTGIHWPTGIVDKNESRELLEGILRHTCLTSLCLQLEVGAWKRHFYLKEIVDQLLGEAANCTTSLVHLRLEGYASYDYTLAEQLRRLYTFTSLKSLHLQLSWIHDAQFTVTYPHTATPTTSSLRYLYIRYQNLPDHLLNEIMLQLPTSLVSLAFLMQPQRHQVGGADLSAVCPHLRYFGFRDFCVDIHSLYVEATDKSPFMLIHA